MALTSGGRLLANSLKSRRPGPILTSFKLRRTLSKACVPHAFCIVCCAKNIFSAASWSNFPSAGSDDRVVGDTYLKRNMTP
jgi:hypothetical protein